jgi:hypothetical protein
MTLDKDQQIEHLQRTCNVLSNALKTVDHEVDRAAAKYLHPTVQTGYLKFADFLELLVREVRVQIRSEIKDERKIATALTKEMQARFEEKLEAKVESLLPVLKGKLSDYITLRVVVQKKATPNIPFARFAPSPTYYAMPIRGSVKQGLGVSPHKAYLDLREKLVLNIFDLGPSEFIHSMFQVKPTATLEKFEKGSLIVNDDLEGFKVEVRLFEEVA